MTESFTELDGHDDDFTRYPADFNCDECGEQATFVLTGFTIATREQPGEVLGYFECPLCGWKEQI